MTRSLFRFLIVTSLLVFCLYYSLSQKNTSADYKLVLSEYLYGQKIYDEATTLGGSENYDEENEIRLNRNALKIFRSVFSKLSNETAYDSLRFFSAFRIGELEHYFEHFKEALSAYQDAINIQLKSRLPDSVLFKPYLYSGIIYYNQNKFDTAAFYFQHAEKIQQEYNYSLQESERLYNTFGVLYYEKGDYKQAKNYFFKALEVLPRSHPYYKELFTNYNINLAQIYFKLEDYDESNKIYQGLLALNPSKRNEIYHNLGMINLYLGAPDNALNYFRKVHYGSTNKLISLYQNIGEAFFNLDRPDSARAYFQRAIDASNNLGSNTDHIAYGLTLKSLGDLESKPDALQALHDYQKAIHQFYPSYADTSIVANPFQFSGVFSYINLFNTLVAKAETFHLLYQQSKNLTWAKYELTTYESAFKLIDYVERTYNSDEARLFLDKIKYVVHIKPIDIAYELYQKTKDQNFLEVLYIFDQQNKASILALRAQSVNQLLAKDSSLVFTERSLRSEITRLSLQASQVYDSIEIIKLNKTIRNNEIELGKIREQLSGPSDVTSIPSIPFLQSQLLDKKTALLSFHLSETKLTTLLITHNRFECSQRELPPGFHQTITGYIDALKNNSEPGTINSQAQKIYSFLIKPINLKNAERLIIIPDDELNYLSFESLQDSAGQYLIQKYAILYQYSTSLLKKETTNFSDHKTLAFAPFVTKTYEDSSIKFEHLGNSLNEINNLQGQKFIDSAATKTNFLNNLSRYKILHLATHAVVNTKKDNLSFVSFYPSGKDASGFFLYAEEIYNLPLNKTDLVILSACETGAGNLVKGEGVMSLSRAFAYAGCPDIITSLWDANDFSTAYLTNRVHTYLDKNYSIDKALRQAKLDYLADKSVNPRLKNPFYWSHLIFIGNYRPENSSSYWWIIYLGTGILLMVVAFFKIIKPRWQRGSSDS